MSICSCGPRCKIECTGGCGCIYVYDTDQCICECFDSFGGAGAGLPLRNHIALSVKGLPLGQVAARFDRLLVREVLVPAGLVQKKVSLSVKRASFGAVLTRLGLSTRARVSKKKTGKQAAR